MLTLYNGKSKGNSDFNLRSKIVPAGTVWLDIMEGSEEEIAFVERATGMHVPSLAEISEIESSSRLRTERGALYLSMPMVASADTDAPEITSIGFILTKNLLITIRFAELKSFNTFSGQFARPEPAHSCSAGAFVGLVDAIIDRVADLLEGVGGELDRASEHVFNVNTDSPKVKRRPARASADLRELLRRIGHNGDLASKIRDCLLGVGRIVPYVASLTKDWFPPELHPHLESQRHDIASLNDYDYHLTNKVQLLLDATLGMINIEQNNIIKVLTVVSVVGVPPTLVASMYGMNFHNMPELSWAWGYQWGLLLILVSAVLPLAWFKLRGWL